MIVTLISVGFWVALDIISGGTMIFGASIDSQSQTEVIIMFVGLFIYTMAVWFAPALVMMHGTSPAKAIRVSFSACLRNILPLGIIFCLTTIIMTLDIIVILSFSGAGGNAHTGSIWVISCFLGFLLTAPIHFLCTYTAYRDIFFGRTSNRALRPARLRMKGADNLSSERNSMNDQGGKQSDTPSAPPVAGSEREPAAEEAQFIPGGRSVPMRNAFTWIADAWGLFKEQPGLWIGFILVFAALPVLPVVLAIPLKGTPFAGIILFFGLILLFMHILFIAGAIYSCDLLRRKGSFTFSDLFVACNRDYDTAPLLAIWLIGWGCIIVLMNILPNSPSTATGAPPDTIYTVRSIIAFVWMVICSMAFWFAPALVMMHGISPVKAIRMSFFACLKNILPTGIIGIIVASVMTFIETLPFLPGLLAMLPVIMLMCFLNYTLYRDIFFGRDK
jgi:hypothetical protein